MGQACRACGTRVVAVLVALSITISAAIVASAQQPAVDFDAVRAASAAYTTAFNARDFEALADQWTERAELVEGGTRIAGRGRIMVSLRGWMDRHPQATLAVVVDDIELIAEPLVRVSGAMQFTPQPGSPPVESRFTSLRVLENGKWRLAESIVVPSHAAALDDLGWLIGRWQAEDGPQGANVEFVFEKAAGGYAIVGHTTAKTASGKPVEAIELFHADREAGVVRAWVFDSTGAMAEGVFGSDGTTFNVSFVGTPADTARGRVAHWVQVLSPTGQDRFTLHAIERTLDGKSVPDSRPMHFRRMR